MKPAGTIPQASSFLRCRPDTRGSLRRAQPVAVSLRELLDAGAELFLRAGFELTRSFARDAEPATDLGEAELVFAVGHQAFFRDIALAFVEYANCVLHRVADATIELRGRQNRFLIVVA